MNTDKLLRRYEKGVITWMELIQSLLSSDPNSIATHLSPDILAELREMSASPPDNPDKLRSIGSLYVVGDFDREKYDREQKLRSFNDLWRWHDYFETHPD